MLDHHAIFHVSMDIIIMESAVALPVTKDQIARLNVIMVPLMEALAYAMKVIWATAVI